MSKDVMHTTGNTVVKHLVTTLVRRTWTNSY